MPGLPYTDEMVWDVIVRRVEVKGDCWIWQGATAGPKPYDYPVVRRVDRNHRVNRLICEWFKGGIGEGQDACHTCNVTQCVNPDHLYVGSRSDNMRQCVTDGRHARAGGRNVKMSFEKARKLRSRWAEGAMIEDLIEEYEIGRRAIYQILNNERWKE